MLHLERESYCDRFIRYLQTDGVLCEENLAEQIIEVIESKNHGTPNEKARVAMIVLDSPQLMKLFPGREAYLNDQVNRLFSESTNGVHR